jgi:TolB-like protein/DNA-binding winged helix-turn-helix (wHTH) protein
MADTPPKNLSGYRVGDLTIDLARRRVSRDNKDIRLGKLSYELLVALARSAPDVLSQEDMVQQVWNGRFVHPPTIKQRITLLRRALDDNANQPDYIKVVRGHGYTILPNVELLYDRTAPVPLRPARIVATLAGIVLLVVVYFANLAMQPAEPPSVAVLPFENLSPEPADSYFAIGLHEEVIDRLSQIGGLEVLSRQMMQAYASSPTPVQDVAIQRGVDAVMAGTVSYRNGQLRITVELVDPDSGLQLWSKTFERDPSNIFEIQDEVAASVAGALGVKMGVRGANAFRGAGTNNIEAYEAFLAGMGVLNQAQGQQRAIAFFRRATALDPDYAAAWAQLGFAIAAESFYSPPVRTAEILDRAMPFLLRAVELDPNSARAAAMLGFVRYSRLDWIGAEKDHTRAIDLRANHHTLSQHATLLVRAGRVAAARSEFSAADSVKQTRERPGAMQIQVSIAQGRYPEARELALMEDIPILRQRLLLNIALNEGGPEKIKQAIIDLIAVESAAGALFSPLLSHFDAPDAALAIVEAIHNDESLQWPAKQHDIALLAAYFGDPHLAMTSIANEVSQSTVRIWALWYPVMSDVRQLPGFKDLVTRLNLVAYWRAYGWADACAPMGEADFRCS